MGRSDRPKRNPVGAVRSRSDGPPPVLFSPPRLAGHVNPAIDADGTSTPSSSSGPPHAYLKRASGAPRAPLAPPPTHSLPLAPFSPRFEFHRRRPSFTPPPFAPPLDLLRRHSLRLRHRQLAAVPVRTSSSLEGHRSPSAAFNRRSPPLFVLVAGHLFTPGPQFRKHRVRLAEP